MGSLFSARQRREHLINAHREEELSEATDDYGIKGKKVQSTSLIKERRTHCIDTKTNENGTFDSRTPRPRVPIAKFRCIPSLIPSHVWWMD